MSEVIYRAYPTKNKNRTLYVGRTKQNFVYYIYKRYRECFITNPSTMRPLFTFLRKKYRTIEGAQENVKWEIIETKRKCSKRCIQLREQFWINKLNPLLNARNEIKKR
jgi:hypothetical protein